MRREVFPATIPRRGSEGLPITTEAFDFFIGRTVLGSEAVVTAIRDVDPTAELLDSEGLLVVPLMQRHRLKNVSEAKVQAFLKKLLEQSAQPITEVISAYTELPYTKVRTRDNVPQNVVYLPFSTRGREGYSHRRYRSDQGAVGSAIGKKADDTPFKTRIAETKFSWAADKIIEILLDRGIANTEVTLSPPQVCKAPKK